MIDNTLNAANKEQRKAVVFSLTFPSLHLVEMASHVGFEAVNIDGEHGYFSSESIDDICRVANGYGMSVTARVPDSSAYWINLFLFEFSKNSLTTDSQKGSILKIYNLKDTRKYGYIS